MNLILGAGLAGLSCSYHLGHDKCVLLEKNDHAFGHIRSIKKDGFTWDEGPHVSFTKHDYVRDLFASSCGGDLQDEKVCIANYHQGAWIPHPAQLNLHAIPDPLCTLCVESFLAIPAETTPPRHYGDWLDQSLGKVFADEFARRYTRKYWTVEAEEMSTEWVGPRVHRPSREALLAGAAGPTDVQGHYLQRFRYPKRGGFQQFAERLSAGANIQLKVAVTGIDLKQRIVTTSQGVTYPFTRLINTLPLPEFISMCSGLPSEAYEAARRLRCSQLLLVNVAARQATPRPNPWIYIYDEDKLSTRINFTERLSPYNAPEGWTGIQVEVYRRKGITDKLSDAEIMYRVVTELKAMGLLVEGVEYTAHTHSVGWANVIFTTETRQLLELIWQCFVPYGLRREDQDTHPLTDWSLPATPNSGSLVMAGRFAQWKYFWTDDCVLRGMHLGAQ